METPAKLSLAESGQTSGRREQAQVRARECGNAMNDKDEVVHWCIHSAEKNDLSKVYYIFRINPVESFYVCQFCFAAIQENVLSELKDIRIKVR